ncbi:hypothetical protein [Streptomyces sp. NPDC002324]
MAAHRGRRLPDLGTGVGAEARPRRYDTSTHDLGFLFSPSWVTAWRLTGDDAWRTGAVRAADSLIQRYNPRGRFIRAWGALTDPRNAGRVIIDTMMNLDPLAFAARQTGDPRYLDIAVEHARTTQRVFPRRGGPVCVSHVRSPFPRSFMDVNDVQMCAER